MLHPHTGRSLSAVVTKTALGSLITLVLGALPAGAQVLVGNPFITSYQNWSDPVAARNGNWRLSLHSPTMMETSDVVPAGSNPPAAENNGSYNPSLLIQDSFTAPAAYDLRARMYSSDDDGFGLVFGYQNPDNYFRAFLRWQSPGNLGGTPGVSVQKVVNGVATQLNPAGTGLGNQLAPTVDQIAMRQPIDVRVAVNGQNYEVYVAGINNNMPLASGTDASLMPGKIGIQSWAQRVGPAATFGRVPHWGTEVETISVMQGANNLYSGTFNTLPVKWRQVVMTNAAGVTTLTTAAGEDIGNFGADINDNWILQQTNGFENATQDNIDFIGPAVVVDDPGSTAFSNYEMRVRVGAADNDGYGVVVRAQNDTNFYRINFANEGLGTGGVTRAPRGLSVQKVRNGVWTELFRDNQDTPLFLPPVNAAGTNPNSPGFQSFDLSVGAVGNSLKVQVRDQNGNVITYPLITDNSDPLLTGSVGFATWGTDNVYYQGYAGQEGTPLLSALAAFTDFDVTINRGTGNITLTNNGAAPVNIKGVSITSVAGGLNPAGWTAIANAYDEPPGNGSVDPDDPWTITSSTDLNLAEKEQSAGGNGATLGVGQTVNLGSAWKKSRIEDVFVQLELGSGSLASTSVAYSGTSFARSDLNTDGMINASDWPLFYPNLLADLSSLSAVGRGLAGDLDSDGDNDVTDFSLFKADFDAVNGAGAFNAMLASVPEPSTAVILLVGAVGMLVRGRRRNRANVVPMLAVVALAGLGLANSASATVVDLTTYTVEAFPPASGFPVPAWVITPSSATLNNNADANVLYSPDSALNKRFLGRVTPGTDDDVIGFVLGFEPGDSVIGSSADYMLVDWKGADQNFNFADSDIFAVFHSDTPEGPMPVGLALSRVAGSPTADEFWQHADLPENITGAVTQLARGATLGSTAYNRSNGSHLFDIRYSPTNVTVLVDGVEQFNQNGSFPDGRFGLYTAWQGPEPIFSNFEVLPVDFVGLEATVDRSTGNITLRNPGSAPFEFDYYQLDSASNSLTTSSWNSLSDQNFQSTGPGAHQKWQEAGGSDAGALAEAFLAGMSTLAGNASVNIGTAYNNLANGEDLVLSFRLPSGLVLQGAVQYVGTAPGGLVGDYNGSGTVDAADYVVWRNTLNTSVTAGTGADGDGNGMIEQNDYAVWRANFGKPGAGSGATLGGAANVPEPATCGLMCLAICLAAAPFRRRTSK